MGIRFMNPFPQIAVEVCFLRWELCCPMVCNFALYALLVRRGKPCCVPWMQIFVVDATCYSSMVTCLGDYG